MAKIAIFASGNGSNFECLAKSFTNDKKNIVALLICDKENVLVLERARKLKIPYELVKYVKNDKETSERKIIEILHKYKVDVIFLAGFMRILSPYIIKEFNKPIINIHPSILPKYKGLAAIEQAFKSEDKEIGITIHFVNEEVDSGKIIIQKSIPLKREKGIDYVEQEIHELEHKWYPEVAKQICDSINIKNDVKS